MKKETVKRIRDNFKKGKYGVTKAKQLYKCTAWTYETKDYIFLESYSTIVAVYSKKEDKIYQLGRYSMTTYQHQRKFQDWLYYSFKTKAKNPWSIDSENLELENWFTA